MLYNVENIRAITQRLLIGDRDVIFDNFVQETIINIHFIIE